MKIKTTAWTAGKRMRASRLVFLLYAQTAVAHVLLVPETYPTINAAVTESVAEDTILVNRGVYPEQLWYPAHRIFIMSHYELTGDTLDVSETVIDGNAYADHDTATIALFLSGAADGSQLCGFTLQNGHGIGPGNHYGAFLADSSSPVICHNVITGSQTLQEPAGMFAYCSGVFRGNHILDNQFLGVGLRIGYGLYWDPVLVEGNTFGYNTPSPNAASAGIKMEQGSRAIIRNNVFRGLTGGNSLAISADGCARVEIIGNMFDSLTVVGPVTGLIWLWDTHSDVVLSDNVFSNLLMESGDIFGLVSILDNQTTHDVSVEGNLFENIFCSEATTQVVPGVWLQSYNGVFRNNIFRSNQSRHAAAVYIGEAGQVPGTGITVEYNLFEACSSFFDSPNAALFIRGYNGPLIAHHNIFRRNYPRVVMNDNIFPNRIADFTLNYWGDPSGPYHPTLNPNGVGDVVGDSVLFDPWLADSLIDEVERKLPPLPQRFSLESYPNPFNAEMRLKLTVSNPGRYRLELYNLVGRKVKNLFEGAVVIDREVTVNGADLPSGVYFAHASEPLTRRTVATAKIILLR